MRGYRDAAAPARDAACGPRDRPRAGSAGAFAPSGLE